MKILIIISFLSILFCSKIDLNSASYEELEKLSLTKDQIDRIIDFIPSEKLTAIKNVTFNEPFFQGHFPNQAVMPGVLVLEAMAQAGSFLVLNSVENPMKKNMFFSSLSEAKFRHPIVPGDQLRIEMILEKFKLGTAFLVGKGYVGDKLVAEGKLKATVVDRAGA